MGHNQPMAANPLIIIRLREQALRAFLEPNPQSKASISHAIAQEDATNSVVIQSFQEARDYPPGRPARPALVHPAKVPRRSPQSLEGRAALLHAIAHIEFNAINLALDAVWRFDGMPDAYYREWALVAREEAYHFGLLRGHLQSLQTCADGSPQWDYGDFDAHDGLWAMCQRTQHDIVARMALVPRTLEARGLDASPALQGKLRQVGTPDALRAVEILEIILRDEVGHVAIGNRWFHWLCQRDGLDPVAHYALLCESHRVARLKPPFNLSARAQAGFTPSELAAL